MYSMWWMWRIETGRLVWRMLPLGGGSEAGGVALDVQRHGAGGQLLLAGDALQGLPQLPLAHPKERGLQPHQVQQVQVRLLLGLPRRLEEAQLHHRRLLPLQPLRRRQQGRREAGIAHHPGHAAQQNPSSNVFPTSCLYPAWVTLLGLTGFSWVFLGFTWFYLVLLGLTGFSWVLLGFTRFYWVLLGLLCFTGF